MSRWPRCWRAASMPKVDAISEPNREVALLLHQLDLELPPQAPPKIRTPKSEL